MNKYMLVLLLAAPGAVYAMERDGDTPPAGVGSVLVPGASLLALVGDKDSSAIEKAFIDKFRDAFVKDMEEVKSDVTSLKWEVGKLQGAFATLQKEESNQNGASKIDDPEWAKIDKAAVVVGLMAKIMELQWQDHNGTGMVGLNSSSAYKTMDDRKKILNAFLKNVTTYATNLK